MNNIYLKIFETFGTKPFFFYNMINCKHILRKYYNHQEHAYCYLGGYKNTMFEKKLPKQIIKIKILKEEMKVKKKRQ